MRILWGKKSKITLNKYLIKLKALQLNQTAGEAKCSLVTSTFRSRLGQKALTKADPRMYLESPRKVHALAWEFRDKKLLSPVMPEAKRYYRI